MENNKKLKNALWCDCDTDQEKLELLTSGRAWETGIIAKSLEIEVANYINYKIESEKEILELRKQNSQLKSEIKQLKQQIEKMKCCSNCKHYYNNEFFNAYTSPCELYQECDFSDKWELAE